MDSIRRDNEKVPAIGNMKVNAKGDQIAGGRITKSADQIARENHRVQATIVNTGLKGPIPAAPAVLEAPKSKKIPGKATAPAKPLIEVELPSGDIVMKEEDDS
jgi:hypothetical protein